MENEAIIKLLLANVLATSATNVLLGLLVSDESHSPATLKRILDEQADLVQNTVAMVAQCDEAKKEQT